MHCWNWKAYQTKLQQRSITLPEADNLISLKFEVFQSMKNNPGEYNDIK